MEITKWDDGRTVWDEGKRVDGRRKEELKEKYIFNKNKQ